MMTIRLPLACAAFLLLAACVDTTGISAALNRPAHPLSAPGAAVIVREYADLQCPACKAAHTQLTPALLERYGKSIRFEYMHFPLRAIHPWALPAAEAAECAADQGKFWEFVDTVYTEQDKLSAAQLPVWADALGLDRDLFDRCTASHIKRAAILAEYDQGAAQGVRGTPTYMVNGAVVESTGDALSKAIEAALQTAAVKL